MSTGIKANALKSKGENITLDFDGPVVSPETLKQAVSAFVELLQEVSGDAAGSGKVPRWNMEVKKGSALFIARPIADTATTRTSTATINAIASGLRLLERGTSLNPPLFNERALKAARSLSSLTEGKQKRLSYLCVRSRGKSCEITPRASASVDKLLEGQHSSWGSVEGKLETMSTRGQLQFVVYDSVFDKGVNCFIDQEYIKEAIAAFGKRVLVRGMIHHDSDGHPQSIKVEMIRRFQEPGDLPTLNELEGIFRKAG